jgi:hypothetical protein
LTHLSDRAAMVCLTFPVKVGQVSDLAYLKFRTHPGRKGEMRNR